MADVLMLAMKKPDKEHRRIPAEQRYRDELEEAGLSVCCLYLEYEVMLLHLLSYYKNTAAFIILPKVSSVSSGDIPIARHEEWAVPRAYDAAPKVLGLNVNFTASAAAVVIVAHNPPA